MSPAKSPEELGAPDVGNEVKIVVEKDEAEELPPGWTKEVKTRKAGSAKKLDRYYTDPVTGYIFHSLKDVQRYLKTGEIGRLATKPKVEKGQETGELKEQMKHKRAPTDNSESPARASKRPAGINIHEPPLSLSPSQPKTRQATRQAGIKIDSPPPLPPFYKTRQATPLKGTEVGIKDNASSLTSPPQPKTRRATRQAGIKINSPPPSPPDTRTTRTRPVNSAALKENNKKTEAEKITNSNHNQDSKEIETVVPPVSSEKQESPVVNPTISNPIPQDSYGYGSNGTDTKGDSSINFSMNDLWTDPCIEFAVKTLTGAIPVTDLNKVENFSAPVQVPLEEIWTDPCIEFAVKTLTGAIPVGEDDYLLHRSASSSNPQGSHQFSSPDVLSKRYETGMKNKQQDLVFGSGGLQKSGKFVNGQCSRSMFFQ